MMMMMMQLLLSSTDPIEVTEHLNVTHPRADINKLKCCI